MYASKIWLPTVTSAVLMILVSSPKKSEMQFCKTTYKPIEAMSIVKGCKFLFRILRKTKNSIIKSTLTQKVIAKKIEIKSE